MKRWPFVILAMVVVCLIALPYLSSNYFVRLATFVCLFAALAQSWNFIGGYAGYPSLATAAFYGLGAYAGAICQNHGVPMVLAWVIASVVVAGFTAALGYAVLRLRGHYFAVGSIVSVELLRLSLSAWDSLTGGGGGLNVPIFPGGPQAVGQLFLYVMLGVALMTLAVTIAVDRSRLGFGLRCIRQNEDAANAIGINTTLYKIIAFVLSGTFCGTVGAIYASWTSYIDPTDSFNIVLTLKVPVMALLGGAGTVFGPAVGAATFVIMEEVIWSNFLEYNRAILGVVIVILIFFLPGGLLNIRLRRRAGPQEIAK
ncbi:MAG: branched-chain amino acid ABC transporter permease [Gammaproteobacteria bacterium]